MADVSLVAAIENALARGQSVESAMQSLVNAGYSKEQVQEAAKEVQLSIQEKKQISTALPIPQSKQQMQQAAKPASKKKMIILLITLLSIIVLGIIAYLIFNII